MYLLFCQKTDCHKMAHEVAVSTFATSSDLGPTLGTEEICIVITVLPIM